MDQINDTPTERAILSILSKVGWDAYIEISDIINVNSFTLKSNQALYKIFSHMFEKDKEVKPDFPSIIAAAKDLNYADYFANDLERAHLEKLFIFNADPANARKFAGRLRKLQYRRELIEAHKQSIEQLEQFTGNESIETIAAASEEKVTAVTSKLMGESDEPKLLGDVVDEYVEYVESNPRDLPGISSGYKRFDMAVGGGLLPGLTCISARMKMGKSQFCLNVALNVAAQQIPVLILDTEMRIRQEINRALAYLSNIKAFEIKQGKYIEDESKVEAMRAAQEKLKNSHRIHFLSIAGRPVEETIPRARRWLLRNVGLTEGGMAQPCLIIYDYIKLMASSDFKAGMGTSVPLGLITSALSDFTVKYELPMLTFCQSNRMGIKNEDTDVIADSDAIGRYVSNLSLWKKKDETFDDLEDGTHAMIPLIARDGAGGNPGDYINFFADLDYSRLTEGQWKSEIKKVAKKRLDKPEEDKPRKLKLKRKSDEAPSESVEF